MMSSLDHHIKNAVHKLASERGKKAIAGDGKHIAAKPGKKKHIGFKGAQSEVEREGYSKKIAGAIIASRSRGASKSAKRSNPHLARVKG
jgi:hypothetical protein